MSVIQYSNSAETIKEAISQTADMSRPDAILTIGATVKFAAHNLLVRLTHSSEEALAREQNALMENVDQKVTKHVIEGWARPQH